MPAYSSSYINDSLGNTWTLTISVSGRLGLRNLGAGYASPPPSILNAKDGSTAHSYQLGIDITPPAQPTLTPITYSAANPLYLTMLDATFQTWYLQTTAEPRFTLSKVLVIPAPKPLPTGPSTTYAMVVYPSAVTGLSPAANSPLYFQRPPRRVPYAVKKFIRHDNRASSGVQEVVYERTDRFFKGDMEYVALDSLDIANWDAFLEVAGQGVPFDLYTDRVNQPTNYTTYFMQDVDISEDYKFVNQYTFKLNWIRYVAWQ